MSKGKYKRSKQPPQFWTKSDLKKLITLWDTTTIQEVAEQLNRPITSVLTKAREVRECGYKLTFKRLKRGKYHMTRETLKELGLIRG